MDAFFNKSMRFYLLKQNLKKYPERECYRFNITKAIVGKEVPIVQFELYQEKSVIFFIKSSFLLFEMGTS
jgi:hypothetical protein